MDVINVLREQLRWAHETMDSTMADVDSGTAHFLEIGKALPVGAAYAHAVMSEDVILSTMLAGKKPICDTEVETGLSVPMPTMEHWDEHENWTKIVKVDLPKFGEYAKKVYQASDEYLASLTDGDLEKEFDLGSMGKQTGLFVISNFLILHMANLAGEVSAAKGFQGKKGYPF